MIDKKLSYEMQGKEKPARNYLGKQKTVTVPVKWKSSPDAPPTELAYITKKEKDLLIKKDIHGSLKKGSNTGPSGVMSLDSQGDYTQDRSPGAYGGGGDNARDREQRARQEQHMREILTGQKDIGQTSAVSDKVREGAVPEYAFGPDGEMKYIGSAQKFVGPSFFNPSGYRDIYNQTGGIFGIGSKPDITFNQGAGQYQFTDPRTGDVKPGIGGRLLGGLASLLTGVPLVGGIIGTAIDKYKPPPKDMSAFSELSLVDPIDQKSYIPEGMDPSMIINDPYAKTLFADQELFDPSYIQSLIDKAVVDTQTSALPSNNLVAFSPGSLKDSLIKNAYTGYTELGIDEDKLKNLMEQDIKQNQEKGTPLSLPKNAYTLIG
jgi:hypothetical protein